MAIDPPYRLDPWQNIVNIHWPEEQQTTSGTGGAYVDVEVNVWSVYYWLINGPNPFEGQIGPGPGPYYDSYFSVIGEYTPPTSPSGAHVIFVNEVSFSTDSITGTWNAWNALEPHDVINLGSYTFDFSGYTVRNSLGAILRPHGWLPGNTPKAGGGDYVGWISGVMRCR